MPHFEIISVANDYVRDPSHLGELQVYRR